MDALAERAPLVEVGAGLGYWAAALRARRVPVLALDSHPPGGVASNSYHGRIPAFTKVETLLSPYAATTHTLKTHVQYTDRHFDVDNCLSQNFGV